MTKKSIQKEVKDRLNDAYDEIKSLYKMSKESSDVEVTDRIDRRIRELEKEKDEIDAFYEEVINSTEEKANELKEAFDEKMDEFKEGVNELKTSVS